MDSKSIFKSKTFWANVLFIAIAVFKHFGVDADGATIDEGAIVAILAVINVGVRFATRQPVHLTEPK